MEAAARPCPSADPGIGAASVDDILATHHDLLSRIKLCYGADRRAFESDLLEPIRNFAAYVNLLPATADNFFCEVGGLFRLGLEVSFYALQGTDGHIVSGRATISARRHLEPRWRHATFLAGLCSEIHRTLNQAVITDERGDEWPAYLGPLSGWLASRQSNRFFVRWLPTAQETRALGLFALPHVVPAATMQHLACGNTVAVPQMLASVAGVPMYREQNILVDLVKRATALVINRNLVANANRYGRPILGAHIERYLLDAMRRLIVSNGAWTPNQERSRVWHGKDGLFIVWPNAANEIRKLLEEDALPGIPKAPETILEILLAAGVLEPRSATQALWTITPPPGRTVVEAIRLVSPEILLPTFSELGAPLAYELAAPHGLVNPAPPAQPVEARREADPAELKPSQAAPRPPDDVPDEGSGEILTEDGEILSVRAPRAPSGDRLSALPAATPRLKLLAPLRLNPAVRDALARAIASMNGEARDAVAVSVPGGVFVPFEHFKQARLDLPVVMRSLGELSMTVGRAAGRPDTVWHPVGGQQFSGLVLKPCFVQGLDPADVSGTELEEGRDAGPQV